MSPEISALTGITTQMLGDHGVTMSSAWADLHYLIAYSHVIVAHNGTGFDKPMYEAHCKRLQTDPFQRVWIDTCLDVPYPESITTRKLIHLAAEHGFLNPFAHRAFADVLTMLKILDCYDIHEVLESAKQPTLTIRANVSYADREKAKARGYRWDGEKKEWRKAVKAHLLDKERQNCKPEFEIGEVV